ncbi:hypothetical protein MED121_19224 [Marinomonas sp. MED121]|uniref:DUF1302 family protein n=1 Tax=Marinomonas sp. MED121 TaxID=314277 RepID=UPI0000690F29|nr:DUF1302 family protein [Marinomonas sp. MED121]EAQ64240.1 hypothetical protein MED121_19224 [Marinomonas sp. MED121]
MKRLPLNKQVSRHALTCLTCLIFCSSNLVYANDDFFADIDVEYEDEEASLTDDYQITGHFKQGLSYGVQDPTTSGFDRDSKGVEELDSSLYLALEKEVSDEVLLKASFDLSLDWANWQAGELSYNTDDTGFVWRDLYLDWAEDDLWIRAGNQILAWGESDVLAITDVVNPRDLSQIGQADLEDIRLQTPVLFASHPWLGMQAELALVYDADANEIAASGEAFDPYINYTNEGLTVSEKDPDQSLAFVGRLYKSFNGGDFAFTLADVNWDDVSGTAFINTNELVFQSSRVKVLGVSGSWVKGDYLFKYDLAQHWDKALLPDNVTSAPWQEYDQTLAALILEYSGIDEWVLTFELDSNYTHSYSDSIASKEHTTGYFARAMWTTLNDQLTSQFSVLNLLGGEGQIYRISADYDIQDGMSIGSEYVVYRADSESDDLYAYRAQDVVKLRYSYHF